MPENKIITPQFTLPNVLCSPALIHNTQLFIACHIQWFKHEQQSQTSNIFDILFSIACFTSDILQTQSNVLNEGMCLIWTLPFPSPMLYGLSRQPLTHPMPGEMLQRSTDITEQFYGLSFPSSSGFSHKLGFHSNRTKKSLKFRGITINITQLLHCWHTKKRNNGDSQFSLHLSPKKSLNIPQTWKPSQTTTDVNLTNLAPSTTCASLLTIMIKHLEESQTQRMPPETC